MTDRTFDPRCFFDAYRRFVETSETGAWLDRLNARYFALIHENRELINGASVLDLASHDGRFSFAALANGARRVIGVEHDPRLIEVARENMTFYGVAPDRYEFVAGDMFDRIPEIESCEVVFCFGILYHINDHMRLLTQLADFDPRVMIFDTNVSHASGAVIELRSPVGGSPPAAGSQIEGWPSRAALEAMWSSFGWEWRFYDWPASGLVDEQHSADYSAGRRVSAVVTSSYRDHSPEDRARAVQLVAELQKDLRSQWFTITGVAARFGMSPQALRAWVRRAEREASRGASLARPADDGMH